MKFTLPLVACALALLGQAARAAPVVAPAAEMKAARQALQASHAAKTLAALDGTVTRASAAQIGVGMAFGLSLANDLGAAPDSQDKVFMRGFKADFEGLLGRYHLTDAQLAAIVKSDVLPPPLAAQGHPFLRDTLALVARLQQHQHISGGSALHATPVPSPAQCDFRVLSPSAVQIISRVKGGSPLQAVLEDGQWKIDLEKALSLSVRNGPARAGAPDADHPKPITPQAAALLKAIENDDLAGVTALLKADPSLADAPAGALPGKASGGMQEVTDTPLVKAIYGGNPAIVTLLLADRAAVNAPDMVGQTPLGVAAGLHDPAIVRLLLSHGGRVNAPDDFGKTPLHEAAEDGHADVVALLLAAGAAVNAREQGGRTPLDFAVRGGSKDVAALLRRHGGRK